MGKLNYKFWLFVFFLIAGLSWSVLPKFSPSFDFGSKQAIEQEANEEIRTTSYPVGQSDQNDNHESDTNDSKTIPTQEDVDEPQEKSNVKVTSINNVNTKNSLKTRSRRNLPYNSRTKIDNNKDSLSASGTSSTNSQGSLMVGGASTPKELKVSETGEGETLLLREALRQLRPGGSILLQKGYYKLHLGNLRIPDSTIKGQGKESILEFNDTFRISTSSLKFQNLKIIHYGTSEAFTVSGGKTLTLEKVLLQSNANDGISISNSHFVGNDLELQGSQHAFLIKDAASFEGKNIKLSDVDYGIYFEGDKDLTINGLNIKNSNVSPIHFVNEGKGQLTCVKCSFDKKPSNNAQRLILKK